MFQFTSFENTSDLKVLANRIRYTLKTEPRMNYIGNFRTNLTRLNDLFYLFQSLDYFNMAIDQDIAQYVNLTFRESYYIGESYQSPQLVIIKKPEHHFIGQKQLMPAIENQLKTWNPKVKDIEVFTTNKSLYCIADKALSNKSYLFLKILQYNLFGEFFQKFDQRTIALLTAIYEEDISKANAIIKELLDTKAIKRRAMSINKLKEMMKTDNDIIIHNLEQEITDINTKLIELYNRYMRKSEELEQKTEQLDAMRKIENCEPEYEQFINHIVNHPYITKVELTDTFIKMDFEAPILHYSDLRASNQLYGRKRNEKAIINIFLTHKYTLFTKCRIALDLNNFSVARQDHINLNISEIIHPHIAKYGCFGSHLSERVNYRNNGDYIGMIDQLTEAVNEVNFNDPPVISYLIAELLNNKMTLPVWQKNETGEMLTTEQVLEEIRDGKTENE